MTYILTKKALKDITLIYPSIARNGVNGVDESLLRLAKPDNDAELNEDLSLDYKGLYQHSIRPFMCDSVHVVFLPSASNSRIICFVKGSTFDGKSLRDVLTKGGEQGALMRGAFDQGLGELDRGEVFDRNQTLSALGKVESDFFAGRLQHHEDEAS